MILARSFANRPPQRWYAMSSAMIFRAFTNVLKDVPHRQWACFI